MIWFNPDNALTTVNILIKAITEQVAELYLLGDLKALLKSLIDAQNKGALFRLNIVI
ncbi:hypothetical protein [Candidatus Parabeggiatoa sp. HSG14]|uniref:hypothetical protein n=1 Tax=Candidatus Parabeggiatoa sp. HSG14 TaxID=3055593 RepID=UPI0025A84EB4|nr:hypothetical protein [Thiotrichales bacterium HSG14]